MRTGLSAALALLLAGCATADVTLLSDDDGKVGAVAVLDAKTEAERGVLTAANTGATLGGGRVAPKPVDGARYAALLSAMPKPRQEFRLYFIEGTIQLTPASQPEMDRLLAALRAQGAPEVQITGHTDRLGSDKDNDDLSRARAVEIRDALAKAGQIPADTRAVGRGEREPVVPTADGVSEPQNRRVEVVLR
jgi:outer membrane protein OmpA-like peptidoglycan-associated protein